ncbi:hypothetical protein ACYF6T_21025 [Streptomyces sp. 7R007]
MSTARHLPRSRVWLRALVLLLALLVPGEAYATAAPASIESTAEYDAAAPVPPPLVRADHRQVVPPRPALLPDPAPVAAGTRPCPSAPPRTACTPRLLRTVVLRC